VCGAGKKGGRRGGGESFWRFFFRLSVKMLNFAGERELQGAGALLAPACQMFENQ